MGTYSAADDVVCSADVGDPISQGLDICDILLSFFVDWCNAKEKIGKIGFRLSICIWWDAPKWL